MEVDANSTRQQIQQLMGVINARWSTLQHKSRQARGVIGEIRRIRGVKNTSKFSKEECSRRVAKTITDGSVSAKKKVESQIDSITTTTKRSSSIGGFASAISALRQNNIEGLS
ncbi:hypothetical protein JHK84_056008 [Glycine max]|nr:hypothetical protein JHK84_056008 [Glycine max]